MKKGFTLLELIIAMGIALVLASGIFAAYEKFNKRERLRQAAATLKNNLRFGQSKAINGEKPVAGCTQLVGYSVTFSVGSYTIQAQCTEGTAGAVTSVTLPTNVVFSGAPSPITFTVLTGTVSTDTTLTVSDGTDSKSIQVKRSGDINEV
jgi:prepilin-type N-terminal cleavage/methylation domain-containing protein